MTSDFPALLKLPVRRIPQNLHVTDPKLGYEDALKCTMSAYTYITSDAPPNVRPSTWGGPTPEPSISRINRVGVACHTLWSRRIVGNGLTIDGASRAHIAGSKWFSDYGARLTAHVCVSWRAKVPNRPSPWWFGQSSSRTKTQSPEQDRYLSSRSGTHRADR